jgi:hypothetical protein
MGRAPVAGCRVQALAGCLERAAVQTCGRRFMAVGSGVAVGVRCLAARGVPHLTLDPPNVGAVRQEPRGVAVAGGVLAAIGQAGLGLEAHGSRHQQVRRSTRAAPVKPLRMLPGGAIRVVAPREAGDLSC